MARRCFHAAAPKQRFDILPVARENVFPGFDEERDVSLRKLVGGIGAEELADPVSRYLGLPSMGVRMHARASQESRGGTSHTGTPTIVRIELHVRPGTSTTAVGGSHDGALVVKVSVPAHEGRATAAALRAVADALGVASSSVTLVRGATTRRKLVEIATTRGTEGAVQERIARLHAHGAAVVGPTRARHRVVGTRDDG